jgi:hypothetical protein
VGYPEATNNAAPAQGAAGCSPAPCGYHYGYNSKAKANITAIVHEDGTIELRTGNIPWRDNNPGDIRDYGNTGKQSGAIGTDASSPKDKHGFLIFPDAKSGEAGMGALIDKYAQKNLTLGGAIAKWAPPGDGNDTATYQKTVATAVGVSQDTKLTAFTPEQKAAFMKAIMRKEGYFNAGSISIEKPKDD